MRRVLIVLAVLVLAGGGWLVYRLYDRPSLTIYVERVLPPLDGRAARLRVTFLGVSTLLLDDGETAVLTDGFFSRPGLLRTVFTPIAPDPGLITRALARAGIVRLAAVVVGHSHYDHVMDAPEVARQTGALLVGSASTANVGRGWGLSEDRMRIVAGGETMAFGRFRVTVLSSRHFPHGMAMGEITAPLRPPVRASAYRDGGTYSILVEHEGRTLLVQGSAGFLEGALSGRRADVVFLGIAGLGTRDEAYREAYWREVVAALGARRVIPIHWDDFTRPLDVPLVPLPRLVDDVDAALRFLLTRAESEGVDVKLVPAWAPFDPFAGL